MASTLVRDLQQFRYVTTFANPLPWPHVRHVSVPELRHAAPDLSVMANLISGLSDCAVSLKDIREHNDADILQLLQVLQACLQFSLWSQNILKKKLLEVQSTHTSEQVSAQQLENLEKRYHTLEQEIAATHKERDMLSLGTANLRASLVQMETTIKQQEQQLQQERKRSARLVAKLEKVLGAQALAAPLRSTSRLHLPRQLQQRPIYDVHTPAPTHRTKKASITRHYPHILIDDADAQRDGTASLTSDTSYGDSCLSAEIPTRAHSYLSRPCDRLDPLPPPFLDWRTLVRYIIREEQRVSAWASTDASPPAAGLPADERRTTSKPAVSLPAATTPRDTEERLPSFLSDLAAGIREDVAAYSRAVTTRTEEIAHAVTQECMQETAKAQQVLITEVQAALGSLAAELANHKQQSDTTPSPAIRTTAAASATSGVPSPHAHAASTSPVLASSSVRKSAAAESPVSSYGSGNAPVTSTNAPPTNESKPLPSPPKASASPLPLTTDGSPLASHLHSFFASSVPQRRSTAGREVLDNDSKRRTCLPDFSPSILCTPPASEHGDAAALTDAGSGGPPSVVARADEDERDVDVDLLPLDSSSLTSPPDSYQSSDKADGANEVGQAYPSGLARPSSAPPVYPSKTPPTAAVVVPSAASWHLSPHRILSSHYSIHSDASEGSSRGSSQMLRETRAQLQALLEEEEAAVRAKNNR
ncbi:conserved hypothetical protein [Leishmania braziliensis MHOM/BR/75/M2904]|uniref:Myotubularin-related 12-like C-terminal domain-containing protein n=2 Tax=Leishmania braziliensis TaxID=5660 RepID=A4H9U1_LEIBR|nr:conserved hypothetical protein [Leishmania braziliensis MHOM/BR/75/M2904]CAJ2468254.1 unnamed protein product [Leishmania braziliensis]CAM38167.1 conserved hypothetical protein [Leishmania braziliensis MHOM/BR/75/M2904]SYZ63571.1 Myotubularin-associated_protein [Leishmania braziliensis MHOM/BR/75/M2904]